MPSNRLYYGDNLDILRERIGSETVALIYLDPPFNSNRSYNVLFGDNRGSEDEAQIHAFDDTWTWTPETDRLYFALLNGAVPTTVADAVQAMHGLLGEGDVLTYIVMMAPRLVELRRVLKPNGSLYLHCDPTASHFLKILMDAVFGPKSFRNEIIWRRYGSHNDPAQGSKHYGRVHDVLLFYIKGDDPVWNQQYTPLDEDYIESTYRQVEKETGRRFRTTPMTGPGGAAKGNPVFEWKGHTRAWRYNKETMERLDKEGRIYYSRTGYASQKFYLDESRGVPIPDIWTDTKALTGNNRERLGYQTQKPLKLLERIISVSSNPGDVVLDPFCGCGTAVVAAQTLKRRWIGIDITWIAVDLMQNRLKLVFGSELSFQVDGIPQDEGGARALFDSNPFDFERWAVSLVHGQPNEKQVGDKGIDGIIRFPLTGKGATGRVLISVKGGQQLQPAMVHEIQGTVSSNKAEMGVLITLGKPTKGMVEAANHSGNYVWPIDSRAYPKVQLITIDQLLNEGRLRMPSPLNPYIQAARQIPVSTQMNLAESASPQV